jgi:serine/threonine protein kinase
VVHRDVKPENVMLARGRAKIGDLGLAKYLREGEDDEAHRLGTLWYSSPEVF